VSSRWTCPRCDREFERACQAHTCVPGCTVGRTFAGREPRLRAIYDEILAHLNTLGDVHEDAVKVGVFLKCERKLAELRPRSRDLLVYLFLPREVTHPRLTHVFASKAPRVIYRLSLREVSDVDDDVRAWLTVAFDHAV